MAGWQDVVDSEPEFARRTQALFDAHKHKTISTLRKSGAPRISGIEAQFSGGHVWIGMMPNSQKLDDVRRDPRIALHSASEGPPDDPERGYEWPGDAKLSGRVIQMDETTQEQLGAAGPPGDYFTIDIDEVVVTRVANPADHLIVELWRPGTSLKTLRA